MLWASFGELRDSLSPLGRMRTTGEWALHVQCAWRLCRHGHIVLAYRDFYYNSDGDALDDWDDPGKSHFDVTTTSLQKLFAQHPPCVTSIAVDELGSITLSFTDDYKLDVFPDDSRLDCEHWRLFKPGVEDSHFVFRESD
jgi:hypothetical protein